MKLWKANNDCADGCPAPLGRRRSQEQQVSQNQSLLLNALLNGRRVFSISFNPKWNAGKAVHSFGGVKDEADWTLAHANEVEAADPD